MRRRIVLLALAVPLGVAGACGGSDQAGDRVDTEPVRGDLASAVGITQAAMPVEVPDSRVRVLLEDLCAAGPSDAAAISAQLAELAVADQGEAQAVLDALDGGTGELCPDGVDDAVEDQVAEAALAAAPVPAAVPAAPAAGAPTPVATSGGTPTSPAAGTAVAPATAVPSSSSGPSGTSSNSSTGTGSAGGGNATGTGNQSSTSYGQSMGSSGSSNDATATNG